MSKRLDGVPIAKQEEIILKKSVSNSMWWISVNGLSISGQIGFYPEVA
jgi:hypothetical protein